MPVVTIDPKAFISWARGIARGVRDDYRFAVGSHEELELEGTALVELVERAAAFDESRLRPGDDVAKKFRNSASAWIRKACQRHAERLRNGGCYKTRAGGPIKVVPLPMSRGEDGRIECTLPAPDCYNGSDPNERY